MTARTRQTAASLAALACALATACSSGRGDCARDEDCAVPASCRSGRCAAPQVAVVSPSSDLSLACSTSIAVQIAVTGRLPDWIGIVRDGVELPGAAALFACEAEGTWKIQGRAHYGSITVESPIRSIHIDRAPPAVTWDPAPGLAALPARRVLVATFDEPVERTSLPAAGAEVRIDHATEPVAAELSADGRRLTLTLPRDLSGVEEVEVLLPALADAAGNQRLPTTFTWRQPAVLVSLAPVRGPYWPLVDGDVTMALTVDGPNVERVVLELIGAGSAEQAVSGPPWPAIVTWSAAATADGSYTLTARAERGRTAHRAPGFGVAFDRVPPTASIVPPQWPPARDGLSVFMPLGLRFSEAVLPRTLTPATLVVTGPGGAPVPYRLELSYDEARIWLEPRLVAPTTLEVTLTSAILDLAGHPVSPVSARFDVPVWLPDELGQPPAGGALLAGAVAAGFAPPSSASAVWIEAAPGEPGRVRWGDVSGTSTQLLNADPAADAALPVLAKGLTEGLTIAWVERAATGHRMVQVWHFDPLGTDPLLPSPQRDLAREAGAPAAVATSALDGGLPLVAWTEAGNPGALLASRWDGSGWVPLGGDLGQGAPRATALARDGSGVVWLAWTEAGGALLVRRLDPGAAAFGPADTTPATGTLAASQPALAIDPSGHPGLAWTQGEGAGASIVLRRWGGASWSAPLVLDGAHSPALAFDELGHPVVAHVGASDGRVRVSRHDGIAWRPLGGTVGPAAVRAGTAPALAADQGGVAHLLFTDEAGTLRLFVENR